MTKRIRIIGVVVGAVMAGGAMSGALDTLFAAVQATRARSPRRGRPASPACR
jgi:putative ABC transport system permease protein